MEPVSGMVLLALKLAGTVGTIVAISTGFNWYHSDWQMKKEQKEGEMPSVLRDIRRSPESRIHSPQAQRRIRG